jgi:tripartite-type tricarboxylate transporter receptor subunit TctC
MKFLASLPALLALACAIPAHAQPAYPTRPVRILVYIPAGGAADLLTRVMAQKLGDVLGQTMMVENRASSGGVIATNVVAKAAPDGYTLMQAGITTHGIGPAIYTDLPYDPVKDFAPIIESATMPVFMMVYAQVPAKSVSDVISLAKAKPGTISFGSPGTGSAPHMVGELFKIVTGAPVQHVPYKGSGTGAPALAAGEIPIFFDAVAGHIPFIKSGRVRAIAVTSAARVAAFPDVPTMKEAGFEKINGEVWYGLVAPAGTPRNVIDKLNAASLRVLAMQEVKDRLASMSIDAVGSTPEEFGQFIRAELDKWTAVVKAAGVKVN